MPNGPGGSEHLSWKSRHPRLTDFLAYISISLVVVAVLVVAALEGASWLTISRWICLAVPTLILTCTFLNESRRCWDRSAFWWLTISLLSAHVLVLRAIVWRVQSGSTGGAFALIFFFTYWLELAAFRTIRDRLFR
jgi:hypothetical protein